MCDYCERCRMSEYIVDWDENLVIDTFSKNSLREEIVRCRDCKHGHEVTWPIGLDIPSDYLDCTGALVETWDYYNDDFKDNPVEPDGFCKWGERREQ